MIYQGSKARLRKYIIPILQECIDKNNVSIEPFVGGANVIDHIKCRYRKGSDNNPELIELLKYMRDNPKLPIFPDNCSFEYYSDVRQARKEWGITESRKYPVSLTAGIGYFASFDGRYFDGGFGKDPTGRRNIYKERLAYAREQAPLLKNIHFDCCDYYEYLDCNYRDCVFYCDIPYKNTKSYNGKNDFDYDRFYGFCREIAKNNYVFISEYEMPSDFKCIWQKERKVMQKSDRTKADVAVEKLFTI